MTGRITSLQDRKLRDAEVVRYYIENGGNARQSAISCGVAPKRASVVGNRLKDRLGPEIREALRVELVSSVPWALNTMMEIARNGTSERCRLKACIDLLDRAMGKPTTKAQIMRTSRPYEHLTNEELNTQLGRYLKVH